MRMNPKIVEIVKNNDRKNGARLINEVVRACSMGECRRIYDLTKTCIVESRNKTEAEPKQFDLFMGEK